MRLKYTYENQDGCIDICNKCWPLKQEIIKDFLNLADPCYIELDSPLYTLKRNYSCLNCSKKLALDDIKIYK